jgi:nucleoside-diphosphate-sugar epimerase
MPESFHSEEELDDFISEPSRQLVEQVAGWTGTTVVLGIAGKMGTHLGMMLVKAGNRAAAATGVIGVSRFSDSSLREPLESQGIRTHVADLLDPRAVDALPDADRVVFMAGRKFGTAGSESLTWATNTLVPQGICRRYAGVPVVAFSTGAVYDRVPVESGGAVESSALTPIGEYANASVGRERIFQYMSETTATPVCLIRLFYSVDLRYGVLRDIGDKVFGDEVIDLRIGYANVIWQGDAVNQVLRSFPLCSIPAMPLNITGPSVLSVRDAALRFGELLGKTPRFSGEAAPDALLGDTRLAVSLFGPPSVDTDRMIRWTAGWIAAGGRSLGKPTHFEVRNGRY